MDIELTFNLDEQKAFLQMLDIALRNGGIANLEPCLHFKRKIDNAVASASLQNMVVSNTEEKSASDA